MLPGIELLKIRTF